MASDDMNHMQHIESVALSDCAVLQTKEATYQGSWKRAGGRSAWFMARRNMDRLLTMMKAPDWQSVISIDDINERLKDTHEDQNVTILSNSLRAMRDAILAEDVFAKIAEKPKGEDGTVLACIRDLRRYFTLVEAEMIAEGVVEPESQTYEQEMWPQDVYTLIANEKQMDRQVVKDFIHDLFYTDSGADAREILRGTSYAIPEASPARLTEALTVGGGVRPGTPEDGGHHASLVPWEIGEYYHNRLVARAGQALVDQFYFRQTVNLWRLEPVVQGEKLLRELKDCYIFINVHEDEHPVYLLDRNKLPEELRDQYPRLQQEMNDFELEQSSTMFKFMYMKAGEKNILRPEYIDWARGA